MVSGEQSGPSFPRLPMTVIETGMSGIHASLADSQLLHLGGTGSTWENYKGHRCQIWSISVGLSGHIIIRYYQVLSDEECPRITKAYKSIEHLQVTEGESKTKVGRPDHKGVQRLSR